MKEFLTEGASKAGKRILARTIQSKLGSDWTSGQGSLVAMADEENASINNTVKVLSAITGIGEFKESKLTGGQKASYQGGIVTVVISSGNVRVEYS